MSDLLPPSKLHILTPPPDRRLIAGRQEGVAVLNLRGSGDDPVFRSIVSDAMSLELPVMAGSTAAGPLLRAIWVGPSEWFLIGPAPSTQELGKRLRTALACLHHAVTEVSSGYVVVQLAGSSVRTVLAAGCPLDLHPRTFGPGSSAGSHFFKLPIVLWQTDAAPSFEVLVRSSFADYFWLMLERSGRECGCAAHGVRATTVHGANSSGRESACP